MTPGRRTFVRSFGAGTLVGGLFLWHLNCAGARQAVVGHTLEASARCDVRLKIWTQQNRILQVNSRDAWYGTHECQGSPKSIGSKRYARGKATV